MNQSKGWPGGLFCCPTLIAVGIAWIIPFSAMADSLEIRGGGQLTGRTVTKGKSVIIAPDDDIQIAFEKSRVNRVVQSADYKQYEEFAKRAGDDAEKHYQLARWCRANGNLPGYAIQFRNYHMAKAMKLDPNHAGARAALGFKKEGTSWVRSAEQMRSRGVIKVRGKVVVPEAAAFDEQRKADEITIKLWKREIKKLLNVIQRGDQKNNRKYAESLQTIKTIKDPLAASAIAKEFSARRPNDQRSINQGVRELRRIFVDRLSSFRVSTSVAALVDAGVFDTDPDIRERCLKALVEYGSGTAVATYTNILRTPNAKNDILNRAAAALQWFPRPEQATVYVEYLVTENTFVPAAGPETQVGFGNSSSGNSGNSFSTGNKPKPITVTKQNPAVLTLVKQLVPEVDFGYSESKWRNYLANQKNQYSGDLRRDP